MRHSGFSELNQALTQPRLEQSSEQGLQGGGAQGSDNNDDEDGGGNSGIGQLLGGLVFQLNDLETKQLVVKRDALASM